MTDTGTVKRIKDNLAFVEIIKTERCSGCRNCAFDADDKMVLPALMRVACQSGDRVELQMPAVSFGGASLILFLLPLMMMLVGFLSAVMMGMLFMLVFGFGLFGLGVVCSFLADRLLRRSPKYMPIVVRIIPNTDETKERNDYGV